MSENTFELTLKINARNISKDCLKTEFQKYCNNININTTTGQEFSKLGRKGR
jgi:hypothetical protein